MPKLFDLLSERTDKEALKQLRKKASLKPYKKQGKRENDKFLLKKTGRKKQTVYIPDFIAIDLETTGLDPKVDSIIEIGAIKFVKGKTVDKFVSLVNPCKPIPPNISELTGITDEAVAAAPVFSEIIDGLLEFIGHLYLCGHQVEFDYNFLKKVHF